MILKRLICIRLIYMCVCVCVREAEGVFKVKVLKDHKLKLDSSVKLFHGGCFY